MNFLKGFLYFILSYIRGPFDYIANKLSFITLIAGVIIYVWDHATKLAGACIIFSFALFVLKKSYDFLLDRLKPGA